jgi:hypothetical protein
MKFKDVYKMMIEGGHAVDKVVPIEQKNIKATLDSLQKDFLNPLGLKSKGTDWDTLGSAGKKEAPSGDLDLAVNLLSLLKNKNIKDQTEAIDYIKKLVESKGLNATVSAGIGVVSFSYPIEGQEDEFVQVDFMLTDDMDFTTWAYFSPSSTESRFKKMGFYRGILLSTVISTAGAKVLKTIEGTEDAEELEQNFMDFSKGFGKKITSFIGKSGKKVKNGKVLDRQFVSKVPDEIIKIVFGKGATKKDTLSFETIIKRLDNPNFKYRKDVPIIKAKVKAALVRMGLPVPEELN